MKLYKGDVIEYEYDSWDIKVAIVDRVEKDRVYCYFGRNEESARSKMKRKSNLYILKSDVHRVLSRSSSSWKAILNESR